VAETQQLQEENGELPSGYTFWESGKAGKAITAGKVAFSCFVMVYAINDTYISHS